MAVVNFLYKIYAIVANGTNVTMERKTPITITASSDVAGDTTYLVPTSTVFTFTDDLDTTVDMVVILSPVNATLEWDTGDSVDNSSVAIRANIPFILSLLSTTEYSGTASTRTSSTLEPITTIRIYQTSGSTQKVRVLVFD